MKGTAIQCEDGRTFYVSSTRDCPCTGRGECWRARCECGEWLTKHDYDSPGAVAGAVDVLSSSDPRPGFGHAACSRSARGVVAG